MAGLFAGTPWERPVTCARCDKPLDACTCPRDRDGTHCPPAQQPARVRREKRRAGKTVTVVTGLDPAASDLPALLRQFKTTCATGGTTIDDGFELQGDHRDRVVRLLRERGYPARPAGG